MSPVAAQQVCCGDIIVFRRSDRQIVHRVLKKLRRDGGVCFVEKGDSARVWGVFGPGDVIGRVSAVKSNGNLFSLSPLFSRLTSRMLSVWFYWTTAIVTRLRSSPSNHIKRIGRVSLRISLLFSSILVRFCCVIWYLSGLGLKRNIKVGGAGNR
jgi:hypothetical protein